MCLMRPAIRKINTAAAAAAKERIEGEIETNTHARNEETSVRVGNDKLHHQRVSERRESRDGMARPTTLNRLVQKQKPIANYRRLKETPAKRRTT